MKGKRDKHIYEGIVNIFRGIEDPRRGNAIVYDLVEVLIIAVLAILCGMEHYVEMEMFGREREEWLREFLKLDFFRNLGETSYERIFLQIKE